MSQNQAMSSKYFRHQSKLWLIGAGVTAAVWLLVWITSSAPAIIKKEQPKDDAEQMVLPSRIENFVDLAKEVKPIDFATLVRDMRTYPAEFKDKTYFENIANKYTVQVMDVLENEVIVDYLDGRSDRKQYAYFRYLDANKKPRYLLTYGQFATADEAKAAITTANLGLPESVVPTVALAKDYLAQIDNYMRADSIADLSSSQPRRINLQATRSEIPVKAATVADEDLVQRSIDSLQARERARLEEEKRLERIATARAQLNQQQSAVNEERSYTPLTDKQQPAQATPEPAQEAAPKPPVVAPTNKAEPKTEAKPKAASEDSETY